jgi:amino acid transporter
VALVHARYRTPYRAIAIQVILVAIIAASGSFEKLVIIANGSVLLVYAACCLATVELRRRDVRAGGIPFRIPAARVVPWLALAVILSLLATLQVKEWLALLAVMIIAVAIYALSSTARRSVVSEAIGD